jgi:hypothetical protein
MKESFSKEIVVTDMEYDIFYKVMQFLYTNTLNLASHDEAVKLLIAADRYQLDYLKLRCAEYLREIIDTDNFDTLLELAFLFNAHTLQVQTVGYTLRLWKSIDKIIEAVMSAQPATSGSDFKSSMKQGESTNYINEKQQKLLDYWNFKEESSVREKEKMLKNMMSDKLFIGQDQIVLQRHYCKLKQVSKSCEIGCKYVNTYLFNGSTVLLLFFQFFYGRFICENCSRMMVIDNISLRNVSTEDEEMTQENSSFEAELHRGKALDLLQGLCAQYITKESSI